MKIPALFAVLFIVVALLCLFIQPRLLPYVLIGGVIAFCSVPITLVIKEITKKFEDKIEELEKAGKAFLELLKISGEDANPKEFEEMKKKLDDWGCIIDDEYAIRYNKKSVKRAKEREISELKDEIEKVKKKILDFIRRKSKCNETKKKIIERVKKLEGELPWICQKKPELSEVKTSNAQWMLEDILKTINDREVRYQDSDGLLILEETLTTIEEHLNKVDTYIEEEKSIIEKKGEKIEEVLKETQKKLEKVLETLEISCKDLESILNEVRLQIDGASEKFKSLNFKEAEEQLNSADGKLKGLKGKIEILSGLGTTLKEIIPVVGKHKGQKRYHLSEGHLKEFSEFFDGVVEGFNEKHENIKLIKDRLGIVIRWGLFEEEYKYKEILKTILYNIREAEEEIIENGNILEKPWEALHPTAGEEEFKELEKLFNDNFFERVLIDVNKGGNKILFIDFKFEKVGDIVKNLLKKL